MYVADKWWPLVEALADIAYLAATALHDTEAALRALLTLLLPGAVSALLVSCATLC